MFSLSLLWKVCRYPAGLLQVNKVNVQLFSTVERYTVQYRYPAGLLQLNKVNVQLFTAVKRWEEDYQGLCFNVRCSKRWYKGILLKSEQRITSASEPEKRQSRMAVQCSLGTVNWWAENHSVLWIRPRDFMCCLVEQLTAVKRLAEEQ